MLRIFYKDNQIIWTSTVYGGGDFPYSIEEELENPKLDGCKCIEITDKAKVDSFMASDSNTINKDKLVIGTPRPVIEPKPVRDLVKEIDELKAEVKALKKK